MRSLLWVLGAILLAGAVLGGWQAYRCVTLSLEAESNLHATNFAVRLVEHFVSTHGRWPRSWNELEDAQFKDELNGETWPALGHEIQRRVRIDFDIDPRDVARLDAMSFSAIQPIGPCYEYRDYGWVESLQETIRKSIKAADR